MESNASWSNVTAAPCVVSADPISDESGYLFGLTAITAGMLTRSISRTLPWCPPYTVIMFVVGVVFERWSESLPTALSTSMEGWKHTHPHFILFVLVPPLLFESSFNVDWAAFRTQAMSSIVLAGPGVLFCTGATALLILPVLSQLNSAFTTEFAFLLAAIVSATGARMRTLPPLSLSLSLSLSFSISPFRPPRITSRLSRR